MKFSAFYKNNFFLIFYLFFLIALFEGSARVFLNHYDIWTKAPGDTELAMYGKWLDRHSEGREIFYHIDVYHPLRGWAVKPDLRNEKIYDGQIINSNSRGLRGITEYAYEKPAGVTRILVFGDSFTFGDVVSDDETYPFYLQQLLPGSEVLNFGVHGYGHDQMLLYLKEQTSKYSPDIVMTGFVTCNILRNIYNFRDYAKPKFILQDGKLVLTNTPIPPPEELLQNEKYRSKFLRILKIIKTWRDWKTGKMDVSEKEHQAMKITEPILDEMIAEIRRIRAEPLFLYIPSFNDLLEENRNLYPVNSFFRRFVAGRDIRWVSGVDALKRESEKGIDFEKEGHWNAKANELMAEAVAEYLMEEGLI